MFTRPRAKSPADGTAALLTHRQTESAVLRTMGDNAVNTRSVHRCRGRRPTARGRADLTECLRAIQHAPAGDCGQQCCKLKQVEEGTCAQRFATHEVGAPEPGAGVQAVCCGGPAGVKALLVAFLLRSPRHRATCTQKYHFYAHESTRHATGVAAAAARPHCAINRRGVHIATWAHPARGARQRRTVHIPTSKRSGEQPRAGRAERLCAALGRRSQLVCKSCMRGGDHCRRRCIHGRQTTRS